MNGNTKDSHEPLYPSLFSPTGSSKETVSDHPPPPQSSSPPPASPPPTTQETHPSPHPPQDPSPYQPGPSSAPAPASDHHHHQDAGSSEKWGTRIMGAPAVPTSHPGNKKAALWSAGDNNQSQHHSPYLQYSPIEPKSNISPMESILHKFNSWSSKAETTANNIWHNLKTGSSVPAAAWDKVNLTAKAITGGGFETLFKQTFATLPNEKLKKTFACYLSTATGPVAGTIYLSTVHLAFCSDRPLSFTAPSGQETWSYYKVLVPLGKIGTINPVVMRDNPSEKYLQVVTVDGHDFWFMGFVNYEKATRHLSDSLGGIAAPGIAAPVHNQSHNEKNK